MVNNINFIWTLIWACMTWFFYGLSFSLEWNPILELTLIGIPAVIGFIGFSIMYDREMESYRLMEKALYDFIKPKKKTK